MVRSLMALYADVEPTNEIVFEGLEQLKALVRDPEFKPKTISKSRAMKMFRR